MKKTIFILILVLFSAIFMNTFTAMAIDKQPVLNLKFDGDFNDSNHSIVGDVVGDVSINDGGVFGKCASFNGGYIELKGSENIYLEKQVSFVAWVKNDLNAKIDTWPILYKEGKDSSAANAPFSYSITYGGQNLVSNFRYANRDYWYNFSSHSNIYPTTKFSEKWTQIAVTLDEGKIVTYIDGKFDSSIDLPDEAKNIKCLDYSENKIIIGKYESDFFRGLMDDISLYDTALTASEVNKLYSEFSGAYNGKIELKIGDTNIKINDMQTKIDVAPIISGDRTLVPIRAVVEAVGGMVFWDANEKRVDINAKDRIVKLWIDSYNTQVDGNDVKIDVCPSIIDGRTMLPLRFVSESLGMKVEWDADTQTITLKYIY